MEFNGEISVTYSGGVLRPDEQLNLPEGARFRATIRPEAVDTAAAAQALEDLKRLRASGAFRSGGRTFTRDQMHERD